MASSSVLSSKYKTLLEQLDNLGIQQKVISESEGSQQLEISGILPSADAKNKIWDTYNQIEPNFLADDLVLNLQVDASGEALKRALVKSADEPAVNIRRGPGVNQPILRTLDNGSIVHVLAFTSQNWCLVRLEDEIEGYCYADYLHTP